MASHLIHPEWAPLGVGAVMSTRSGGQSVAPFHTLNLGIAVGDDPLCVEKNRARFASSMEAVPVFMRQVHGSRVLELRPSHALPDTPIEDADAAVTTEFGLACTVQVADCLPVLFAVDDGRTVGAAHAGWRGLAGGVLDNTVQAICTLANCPPERVHAWLGPCIGPSQFEVGADVLDAFGAGQNAAAAALFRPSHHGKWLADLPGLARLRLLELGLLQVSGGQWCTVSDPSRFFSFRRDRVTGRMAAAIWRLPV